MIELILYSALILLLGLGTICQIITYFTKNVLKSATEFTILKCDLQHNL